MLAFAIDLRVAFAHFLTRAARKCFLWRAMRIASPINPARRIFASALYGRDVCRAYSFGLGVGGGVTGPEAITLAGVATGLVTGAATGAATMAAAFVAFIAS